MPTPPLLSTPPPSLSSRLAAQWKWETSDSLLVNNGSCCRDYLGTERTALSYLRLTLILSLLSTALVAKVRLPSPESSLRGPSADSLEDLVSLPLGIVFAVLALLSLFSGTRVYWMGIRGLRDGKGFVGAGKLNTLVLVLVALGIVTSIVILIVAHPRALGG
ncbi:hypothetical protein BDY24DRAFT_391517 [Mrakia frigida]|uniref:uncharacterized protein n=1 Tax=Mrakia frigida TaxID=29902 RepID=UPI003FCBFE06